MTLFNLPAESTLLHRDLYRGVVAFVLLRDFILPAHREHLAVGRERYQTYIILRSNSSRNGDDSMQCDFRVSTTFSASGKNTASVCR